MEKVYIWSLYFSPRTSQEWCQFKQYKATSSASHRLNLIQVAVDVVSSV